MQSCTDVLLVEDSNSHLCLSLFVTISFIIVYIIQNILPRRNILLMPFSDV